jgi:hypothetical protein
MAMRRLIANDYTSRADEGDALRGYRHFVASIVLRHAWFATRRRHIALFQ